VTADPTRLLRTALRTNAAFSALSALVLLAGDGLVAALLGAYHALAAIHLVGVGVGLFAGFVLWVATRDPLPPATARAVIAADLLWVIASWAAIAAGWTSGQGSWLVGIVADIVLLIAIAQIVGLRRLPQRSGS
jgi:hypothetical protein